MEAEGLKDYPDFLKVGEVATLLRVDRKTVYDLITLGQLPAMKLGRRGLVRITKTMLMSFVSKTTTGAKDAGTEG